MLFWIGYILVTVFVLRIAILVWRSDGMTKDQKLVDHYRSGDWRDKD